MKSHVGYRGGLKSCLSAWKSSELDSTNSPKGFQVLSKGLQPRRSAEESK
ncbi:MAG: hypothetical protein LDL51_02010 [Chloroflexi bacterium]|nr:hypothetical protein [Chloroflexota bacterium]